MADWAKQKFEELKAKEGASHEEANQQALIRQQVMADAPHLWQDLTMHLRKEIADFNHLRPGYLNYQPKSGAIDTEVLTISSAQSELTLTFYRTSPRIVYNEVKRTDTVSLIPGDKGTFIFVLLPSIGVAFKKEDSGSPVSHIQVAEFLLNHLA